MRTFLSLAVRTNAMAAAETSLPSFFRKHCPNRDKRKVELMRISVFSVFAMIAALSLPVPAAQAEDGASGEARARAEKPGKAESIDLTDQPLETYRRELLELAYEGASAYPTVPHIKNKGRAQEEVVRASLELDQPRLALRFIRGIENWRRGANYAELGHYLAKRGKRAGVERLLERAELIAAAEGLAKWRRDRIRAKVGRAYALLGRGEKARSVSVGLGSAERGKLTEARAAVSEGEAFETRMEEIDKLLATKSFGPMHNALAACARLYERFYEDSEKRERVMEKVEASWGEIPVKIRLEVRISMIGAALDHADPERANELIDEAWAVADAYRWELDDEMAYRASLVELRHRAGHEQEALEKLELLRSRFDEHADEIANYKRAGVLRSVAEACTVLGLRGRAFDAYRKVTELGVVNPNMRPRIRDFVSTCCSMALHGVEPDAELWSRLREIREGLGPQQ